jgi:hypothetical protein
MAKKRKAKIKRKRAAKKSKPQKSKAKKSSNVDALTPFASDDALERAAGWSMTVEWTH